MDLKSWKSYSLLTLGLGVLVACPSQISGDDRAATQGLEAIPLVCPSILGQTWQNAKAWGSTSYEKVTGVATDANCNVFVTGSTSGAMNTIGSNPLGSDAFITKFSRAGTLLWTVQAGGDGEDYSNAIAVDSSGNVLIAGYSTGDVNGVVNQGGRDAFVMKYDTNGTSSGRTWAASVATTSSTGLRLDRRTIWSLWAKRTVTSMVAAAKSRMAGMIFSR
jgi:hypothetical protein